MPRKAFVADLQEVLQQFNSPNVCDLKPGGEDGSVTFQYKVSERSAPDVTVQAFIPGKQLSVLKTSLTALERWVFTNMVHCRPWGVPFVS